MNAIRITRSYLDFSRAELGHIEGLLAQMSVEIARIGNQIDEAALDEGQHLEKENHRLEKFLSIDFRVFDRAVLRANDTGMQERVLDENRSEIERCAKGKISYGRRMN